MTVVQHRGSEIGTGVELRRRTSCEAVSVVAFAGVAALASAVTATAKRRGRVGLIAMAIGMLGLVFALSSPTGSAIAGQTTATAAHAKRCGTVFGKDNWAGTRATVKVRRGRNRISCRTARGVGRKLFSSAAHRHDGCGAGYCSYTTVRYRRKLWRGDARMNYWTMMRCRDISGCHRVVGGTYTTDG